MPADAIATAIARGVPAPFAASHRAQPLTVALVEESHLILGMTREHRRMAVEMSPARTRSAFTALEFARLTDEVSDSDFLSTLQVGGDRERLARALSLIASRRGLAIPGASACDDIIDPYGRSARVYEESASQLDTALFAIERVLRLVAS